MLAGFSDAHGLSAAHLSRGAATVLRKHQAAELRPTVEELQQFRSGGRMSGKVYNVEVVRPCLEGCAGINMPPVQWVELMHALRSALFPERPQAAEAPPAQNQVTRRACLDYDQLSREALVALVRQRDRSPTHCRIAASPRRPTRASAQSQRAAFSFGDTLGSMTGGLANW